LNQPEQHVHLKKKKNGDVEEKVEEMENVENGELIEKKKKKHGKTLKKESNSNIKDFILERKRLKRLELEKLKEEGAFVKQLELLKSLGYDNELQNLKLLQRFEGNMEKVLERLVSKNEKYQNNKRFFDKKESNETSKDHSKIKKERFSEEERKEIDDLKEKNIKIKTIL